LLVWAAKETVLSNEYSCHVSDLVLFPI
jgi:hypothetical protein